jgi:hypothetical protein
MFEFSNTGSTVFGIIVLVLVFLATGLLMGKA